MGIVLLGSLCAPPAASPTPSGTASSAVAAPSPAQSAAAGQPADARAKPATALAVPSPGRSAPDVVLAEPVGRDPGPPPLPEPAPVHVEDTSITPSVTSVQALAASTEHLVRDDNSAQIRAVFDAINAYRASLGLGRILYHATVAGLAQEWSDSIASREVIEHRPSFWTDPRALSPDRGAGEVIAVRWDRNTAEMVAWWKNSPAHNAILIDPRLNVMGVGITFTDGTWQTTPTRYATWGVVNLFGYSALPAGTVDAPGSTAPSPTPPGSLPQPVTQCTPTARHMPPTRDLSSASITGPGDVVAVDAAGTLWHYPATGTGALGARRAIAQGLSGSVRALTADWDRDGVYDVLVQGGDGRVTLLPGRLEGGFGTAAVLGQSGWAGYGLAVGEWCERNRLPQLLARDGSGAVFLYPNNPGLTDLVQRASVTTVPSGAQLGIADVDGDGLDDALVLSGGVLSVAKGTGDVVPAAAPRRTLAADWSAVRSFRVVEGFLTGAGAGIIAVRTDGTAVYYGLSGGSLVAPRALPGSFAGLTLAG
ncbi:hypothetical protein GCM10028789_19530 [Sinomonas halotolerans]